MQINLKIVANTDRMFSKVDDTFYSFVQEEQTCKICKQKDKLIWYWHRESGNVLCTSCKDTYLNIITMIASDLTLE